LAVDRIPTGPPNSGTIGAGTSLLRRDSQFIREFEAGRSRLLRWERYAEIHHSGLRHCLPRTHSQHHVAGLQIAVDNARIVHRLQTRGDLLD